MSIGSLSLRDLFFFLWVLKHHVFFLWCNKYPLLNNNLTYKVSVLVNVSTFTKLKKKPCLVVLGSFETGSHCVAQDGLKCTLALASRMLGTDVHNNTWLTVFWGRSTKLSAVPSLACGKSSSFHLLLLQYLVPSHPDLSANLESSGCDYLYPLGESSPIHGHQYSW